MRCRRPSGPVMNPSRALLIGIAAVAGTLAFYITSGREPPPPPPPVVVAAAPSVEMIDVLVASADLPMGQVLKPADLRWQPWPRAVVNDGFLLRPALPTALEDTAGSFVRGAFLAGEPIRREKLIKANGGGFLSAMLPAGMRAMAISIDTRGSNTAGGFILPNDRVDVVRTQRDGEPGRAGASEAHAADTILTNVRVLAVGQTVQERNGERVVTGDTATLEVTPGQAEMLALAQRAGQLSLTLRSIVDAAPSSPESPVPRAEGGLTVIRYGVAKPMSAR